MTNHDVSVNVIKKASVGTATLELIGLLLAIFRLWFRFRIRRLWWEDAWAFAAFVFATNYLVGSWLYVHSEKPTSTVGYWMSILTSNPVIWLVRHRMVLGIALIFFLLSISFMAAKLWYYCRDLSWMNNTLFFGSALLPLSTNLIIFELTIDFIADAVLIVLPVKLFWSVKLPTRQRRMIQLVFASRIMVTIAAICRAICQLLDLNLIVPLVMDVEVALSSIMCNLLVFVAFLYRYGRSASPPLSTKSDEDNYTTPFRPRQTSLILTIIEVGEADYSGDEMSTWSNGCTNDATSGVSDILSPSEEQSRKQSS